MLCYGECKQKFILCRAYIEGHQLRGLCQCAAMSLCRDTSDDIPKGLRKLSCTCIYLPCIITINVLTVSFLNNSIITAPTCALITTSWYTKMVQMYNIKLTEHLLYTRILCLLLSLYHKYVQCVHV